MPDQQHETTWDVTDDQTMNWEAPEDTASADTSEEGWSSGSSDWDMSPTDDTDTGEWAIPEDVNPEPSADVPTSPEAGADVGVWADAIDQNGGEVFAPPPPSQPPVTAEPPAVVQTGAELALPHRSSDLVSALPEPSTLPAQRGWRSLFKLPPGQLEVEERLNLEAARTNFGGPKSIVVANPKGGSGKSPLTLLLAGAFGTARGGSVVAWDNNELRGTMPLRTRSNGVSATVRDVLEAIDEMSQSGARVGDLHRFMRHQGPGQYDALVSRADTRHEVTADDFNSVAALLERFYQLMIIDTGNNEAADNWRAAIASADALVVPVKWSASSCMAAVQMLEELQGTEVEPLVRNTIVAVSNGPGDVKKETREKFQDYFQQRARAVVEIPTDQHIADDGPIDHNALGEKTQLAALRLAAEVSNVLADRPPMWQLQEHAA